MSEPVFNREPLALSAPDRSKAVEVTPGMRVLRRPIFQARYGQEGGWGRELVDRIAVAKSLGFTAFEIDVAHVKVEPDAAKERTGYITFGFFAPVAIEGEEWKGEKEKKDFRADIVITVYALVVE